MKLEDWFGNSYLTGIPVIPTSTPSKDLIL